MALTFVFYDLNMQTHTTTWVHNDSDFAYLYKLLEDQYITLEFFTSSKPLISYKYLHTEDNQVNKWSQIL